MNSGSFFLAEMSRTISSFSPGGADSASTSVTKPYLYSVLTNPSIVSVAVLIYHLSRLTHHVSHLAHLALPPRIPGTAHEWQYHTVPPQTPSAALPLPRAAIPCRT